MFLPLRFLLLLLRGLRSILLLMEREVLHLWHRRGTASTAKATADQVLQNLTANATGAHQQHATLFDLAREWRA